MAFRATFVFDVDPKNCIAKCGCCLLAAFRAPSLARCEVFCSVHKQLHANTAQHVVPLRVLNVFSPSPAPRENGIIIKWNEPTWLQMKIFTWSEWPSQAGYSWTEAKLGERHSGLGCGRDSNIQGNPGEEKTFCIGEFICTGIHPHSPLIKLYLHFI